MMMKQCLSFVYVLLLAVVATPSISQGYYSYDGKYSEPAVVFDLGGFVGGINSMTDIGGNAKMTKGALSEIAFKYTNLAVGLSATATYKDAFALRLEYMAGTIEGADSNLSKLNAAYAVRRTNRNLSFKTSIRELSLSAEIHPLYFFTNPANELPRLSPYFTAGAAWFTYNPRAQLNGIWYDLLPLRLDGQGFAEYPGREINTKNEFSFPIGIGVRYEVSERFFVRAEFNGRFTTTDYLDAAHYSNYVDPALFSKYLSASEATVASQLYSRTKNGEPDGWRASPTAKDVFATFVLKFGFVLNRKRLN